MHIVFHTHEYPGKDRHHGGIGTIVKFLANQLTKQNIKVSVVGLNNKYVDETEQDGKINIYRIRKSKWKKLRFIDNSRRILKKIDEIHAENPIDIVEGSELTFAFYPQHTPYKKVIRLHGGHHFFSLELGKKPKFWRSYQEKKSFNKADAYIAVSDYVGRQTQKYLKKSFDYKVIYNTLEIEKFTPSGSNKVIPYKLLFVGTVCEKKGIRQLIMALPEIIKKFPKVHLDVVGRDWYFPGGKSYIDFLQQYITPDIQNNISFHGVVNHDKVKDFIDQSEICVYPSHMEAMPLSWIEVLLSAKPFVGGDIGPGKEIVISGKTGLLADPKNPDDIAKKVIWLLEHKDSAIQMGIKAREHILKILHPDKIIRQNIEFYQSLL